MVVFFVVSLKFKAKEAGFFGDVVDDDVFCIVLVFSCADFDLLEVAEVVITGTTSKGYSCVEKVDEFGRSCEVVLGDWLVASSLGCVSYDDGCQVVFLLEAYEFHHEVSCSGSFFSVVADKGDVVHDEEFGSCFGCFFYRVEDFLFEVGAHDEFRVDFGSVEVLREDVNFACGCVGVSHLELLAGEFKVEVEDFLCSGDVLCYLDGEDGFADIAGGENDGILVLDYESMEEGLWVGCLE